MVFSFNFLYRRRQKASQTRLSNGSLTRAPTTTVHSAELNFQLQSLFLKRLPLDIRLLIYEYALCPTPRLHIIHWNNSLAHTECNEPQNASLTHGRCWDRERPEDALLEPDGGKMGILLSCKLVYSEAIGILYTRNTFDLNALATFTSFTTLIPRASLNSIHALNLSLFWYAWFPHSSVEDLRHETCPPEFKFEWKRACNVLVKMEGLQYLRLRIGFGRENWRRAGGTEVVWFRELKRVGTGSGGRLRRFEVEVNWPKDVHKEDEDGLPFNLLRSGQDTEQTAQLL